MSKLTDIQKIIIDELYPHIPTQDVIDILGMKVSSVYNYVFKMKLKKTEEFYQVFQGGRYKRNRKPNRFSFQKGHIPHNKGKQMSQTTYNKLKHTFFNSGHQPHNTKYDGHERVTDEGYVMIRVSAGTYRLKHRVIYEQYHNVKLTVKDIIKFKDGNKNNFEIDNLYLTDRRGNMLDNTIHKYPKEINQLIRINNKLKRLL